MQTRFFIVVAILFALASAQTLEVKQVLDAYTVVSDVIVIVTPASGVPAAGITETRISQGSSIVGGERDLKLTAEIGSSAVFSTVVSEGEWSVSTPNAASGFVLTQYDGLDSSLEISTTTMNVNLKENGADRIRTLVVCDIPTIVSMTIYEGSQICVLEQEIQGDQDAIQEFFWSYTSFSGSCGFTNVNAIELLIEAFDNVDITFSFFGTYGPLLVSSPSPSPTPSPGVPAICTCSCPKFICGVVFKGPSDDDDTIDDDSDDDDIVFRPVYYGPVDDDFDSIDGDDDDYEWLSLKGGLTIDHQDDDDDLHDTQKWSLPTSFGDDDESTLLVNPDVSGASILSVSLMVLGAAVILF